MQKGTSSQEHKGTRKQGTKGTIVQRHKCSRAQLPKGKGPRARITGASYKGKVYKGMAPLGKGYKSIGRGKFLLIKVYLIYCLYIKGKT